MTINDPELMKLFREEARELIEKLRQGLDHWQDPEGGAHNPEAAKELFRCAHTLKGISGAVQRQALAELSKAVTELLRAVKDGRATLTNGEVPLLLRSLEACQRAISEDRVPDYEELLVALQKAGQT